MHNDMTYIWLQLRINTECNTTPVKRPIGMSSKSARDPHKLKVPTY